MQNNNISFKEKIIYIKGKIYLKQLLNDTFAVKRYIKGLLFQIKEEKMCKIISNEVFADDEEHFFKK